MLVIIRLLTSSLTWRFLFLIVTAGLIYWRWESLLRTFGVGIVLLLLVAAILNWAIWKRRILPFIKWWNYSLGALVFAAAVLGILAFFTYGEGILYEESLGGSWGKAISADQGLIGGLRVIGLVIVGIAFVGPRFTWSLLRKGKKEAVPTSRKVAEGAQRSVEWIEENYSRYPVHRIVIDWTKEHVLPSKKEPTVYLLPPPSQVDRLPEKTKATVTSKEPTEVKVAARKEVRKLTPPPSTVLYQGGWQLPSSDLLDKGSSVELNQAELERRAKIIEDSLASYGVEAKVTQTNVGPAVTQFGVEPGWDRKLKQVKEKDKNGNNTSRYEEVSRTRVKVERIASLSNDLALALAASSIRIEAPVPGKSIVGIEIPNSSMGVVALREVIEGANFQKFTSKSKLVLALGKGTASELLAADLAKMPHLLIAGATGSGKSVCLNSTIASLLMNNTPDDLKFIMIDPKRVELIAWSGVPHLMVPVVTESEKAVEILKWMVQEMENRYNKLAQVRAHNIEAYNKSDKIDKQMPALVGIIDELADLMIAKSDEVEPLLCRLAQMGRAVGIHLIVATQRPSVDVITGLIKANFPTRISFAVASQVDSRTILDAVGAEKLLGRGDMLYLPPDIAKPIRLQACFLSSEEIERLESFWIDQSRTHTTVALNYEEGSDQDPILAEARRLAKERSQISVSFLQRQLRVGYSRAVKLMEQIQEEADAHSPGEEHGGIS